MSTDVLMPQMGESVAEGTIVRWIKKVGDTVDKDEPLFEISTDKVDAEIPAPAAGTLVDIKVKEGDTVAVNTVVAVIGRESDVVTEVATSRSTSDATAAPVPVAAQPSRVEAIARDVTDLTAEPRRAGAPGIIERRRTRSSPVVRRIASEHSIDISRLTGSGISGRVTRRDIEGLVRQHRGPLSRQVPGPPPYAPGDKVRIEKMSVMRKKIAEHMRMSVQTSPHVYSTYEIDFSRLDALRLKHKARYERAGTRLTYTVFIARATAEAIRECPFANASIDDDNVVYKDDINLGIAVALEQGLIVPVIRHADRLSIMELSRAIQDLADRARTKQLKVDEVQGGTFTITNPGIFGAAFGFPIISQPQVAILAVGSVEKRAVVVGDQVVARPMCYMTLGHDHRLIDGAEGARFLRALKTRLEHFSEELL
jgi:2-oxoglutarate dehydrogenase E2 component (dihydrolipoamide succinyltransferase)